MIVIMDGVVLVSGWFYLAYRPRKGASFICFERTSREGEPGPSMFTKVHIKNKIVSRPPGLCRFHDGTIQCLHKKHGFSIHISFAI